MYRSFRRRPGGYGFTLVLLSSFPVLLVIVLPCFLYSVPGATDATDLRAYDVMALELLKAAKAANTKGGTEKDHVPVITAPRVVEGGEVSVTVEVKLPPQRDHYIKKLVLIDENSFVKLKYVADLGPEASPKIKVNLVRLLKGTQLKAIAECNQHGMWMGVSDPITVGQAGCGGSSPMSTSYNVSEVIKPNVRQGVLAVLLRHLMESGFTISEGKFVKRSDPIFIKRLSVQKEDGGAGMLYQFLLTPGLSNNPVILLPVKPSDRKLKIVAESNLGRIFRQSVSASGIDY